MKAYKVSTGFGDYQNHLVIADNMAEAERVFNGKYWPTTIKSIDLISEYVQIQKFDEQPNYPYKKAEEDLKNEGFDVIVFVPSHEEDKSKITCGNAILATGEPRMAKTG